MTLRWQDNVAISVALRGGRRAVAQLMKSPHIQFFDFFVDDGAAIEGDLADKPRLFCAAVAKQFVPCSDARKEPRVRACPGITLPTHVIATHAAYRKAVVWPGSEHEREVTLLGGRPGGLLIERGNYGVGEEIDLDDDDVIDGHELNRIWLFPQLNERLYLSDLLGRPMDPLKDLTFDRPLPLEARTYVDILSSHGDLEDWGYTLPPKAAAKRAAASKKKAAKTGKKAKPRK